MQTEQNSLPDFLTQQAPLASNENTADMPIVAAQPLRKILKTISLAWFCVILIYLHFFFGWKNLAAFLPIEFVQFIFFATVPLVFLLLMVALIYKAVSAADQSAMVQKSLEKVLFNDQKNVLTTIFDQDLQKQIGALSSNVRFLSEQTETLKHSISSKAEDFSKIGSLLENNFMTSLQNLNTGIASFKERCQSVTSLSEQVAEDLTKQSEILKESAQSTAEALNPLINETIAASDHLQNVAQNSKKYVAEANNSLALFSKNNQEILEKTASMLTARENGVKESFLKTADSCAEIFKRLDSGVSFIENSLKTHKALAAEQAALIDKNATYLDNKLGEYGRLISMEVEEMVKRSSTLDMNVKKQLGMLNVAGGKMAQILEGVNDSLEQKSVKAVKNIEKIISNLEHETEKLSKFVQSTEKKNNEVGEAADKITQKIGAISADLGHQVDNLKIKSVEAIDKFNEVSGLVQKNAAQLSETVTVIASKGRENAELLQQQNADVVETMGELNNVKGYFADISTALKQAGSNAAQLFSGYKTNVAEFNSLINRQLEDLSESRRLTEEHLEQIQKRYDELDVTNFIDRSAGIIQNLNNISVDLNDFFNKDRDEGLWKKFYSGDYSAFARNVVKNMTRKQILKIKDEYEKNLDFRQMTDRYISEFETLLNGARNSEKPQIILALLSGSELGKIYYIMARALDRLE